MTADAWSRPTPCDDWDVRYLVAHVVGGNRFAVQVLDGASAADAIAQVMSSPQLGDDALGAWTSTVTDQRAAFRADPDLERTIDHPLGTISVREFLGLRVFDVALHAWDLARAIGADERLDTSLVDVVLAIIAARPAGMGFGITPLGRAPHGASAQDRLLDLTGRAARQ